ncbi:MAG: hypothetical protein KatS3mg110_0879 [Pirellulaceae bacterium]|nr:MAG: hypothetical protein KatS3mg110_0879 [Pirellulaceae bacterium]
MVDHVLHPNEVGIAHGRHAVLPALILGQALAAPLHHVEGRIGEDEIRLEVRETVVVEGVAMPDAPVNSSDGEVHLGQAPRGVVELLAVDADLGPGEAALLALGARELAEEVIVNPPQHIFGSGVGIAHADVRHQVNELSQSLLIEGRSRIVLSAARP